MLPPHETRAHARRRRQIYTFGTLISAMLLAGLLALGNWLGWWTIGGSAQATSNICPIQAYTLPKLTKVNVYNGTSRHGLASTVARELRARKFQVGAIATAAQSKPLRVTAVVRYGEFGGPAARTLAAQFPGKVSMVRDSRNTRTVDVVLGDAYASMVARAKAAKAIQLTPQPANCTQPASTATPTPSPSAST